MRSHATLPACPLCGPSMVIFMTRLFDDRYGFPGYYDLIRCRECGLIETWPQVSSDATRRLYTEYYPRRHVDLESLPGQLLDPVTPLGRFRIWLQGAGTQGHLLAHRGMKALDLGCGMGTSLMELERMGVAAYGVEVDANVARVARHFNLRIHIGSLSDRPFPETSFDLISMNQVIEHIPDLPALLGGLKDRLVAGGKVAVAFPNVDSLSRRLFGRRWINWHVPYHLHHFNRRSFRRLCECHGWRITRWRTATPDVWTLLQLRALGARARMGTPSPLWTSAAGADDRGVPSPPQVRSGRPGRVPRRLARFVLKVVATTAVTAANRVIDLLGIGDAAVAVIEPRSP